MEQQLINQLITLIRRSGGESLIRDLLWETDQDGDSRHWTTEEIENAENYVRWINESYSTADAINVITNLVAKYNINLNELSVSQR